MIAILAAVAALAAFDLTCTGTETTGLIDGGLTLKGMQQKAFNETYRVNLSDNRWCKGECASTSALAKVTETEITIEFEENTELQTDTVTIVNRESGMFAHRVRASRFVLIQQGQCERSSFKGFPAKRF